MYCLSLPWWLSIYLLFMWHLQIPRFFCVCIALVDRHQRTSIDYFGMNFQEVYYSCSRTGLWGKVSSMRFAVTSTLTINTSLLQGFFSKCMWTENHFAAMWWFHIDPCINISIANYTLFIFLSGLNLQTYLLSIWVLFSKSPPVKSKEESLPSCINKTCILFSRELHGILMGKW